MNTPLAIRTTLERADAKRSPQRFAEQPVPITGFGDLDQDPANIVGVVRKMALPLTVLQELIAMLAGKFDDMHTEGAAGAEVVCARLDEAHDAVDRIRWPADEEAEARHQEDLRRSVQERSA